MRITNKHTVNAGIAPILICTIFFNGCIGGSQDPLEVLNKWQHGSLSFSLERDCPGTAVGRCYLYLFENSARTWWSPDGKWILKCSSAFRSMDLTFLNDSILAIALYSPSSITVDPYVILNMSGFKEERTMTTRKPGTEWKSLNIQEHTIYSVETFQAPEDKNDFALNIWKKDNSISQRNLYVLDANNISIAFVEDSTLKVTIQWTDDPDIIDLYLKLWREGDANVEIIIR